MHVHVHVLYVHMRWCARFLLTLWLGLARVAYPSVRAGFMVGVSRESPVEYVYMISSPLPLHTHILTHSHTLYTTYILMLLSLTYSYTPVQLFRADLISAMKLPDSTPMESGSFLTIREPWRTEWEIGVQVRCYKKHGKVCHFEGTGEKSQIDVLS